MDKTYFKGYFETGCFDVLADSFPLVSVRGKTEPGAGSPCYRTKDMTGLEGKPERYQFKRNGDVVVFLPECVLKFWKDRGIGPL